MKNLKELLSESLFDQNLTNKELPIEKLLKSNIELLDIRALIYGYKNKDFRYINNMQLKIWAKKCEILNFGEFSYVDDFKDESVVDAINWLKFLKIHDKVSWNDCMYANTLDISWDFWGDENERKDIFEWIMFKGFRSDVFVLVNRKDYSEQDQLVIHKLIETVNKKGTR